MCGTSVSLLSLSVSLVSFRSSASLGSSVTIAGALLGTSTGGTGRGGTAAEERQASQAESGVQRQEPHSTKLSGQPMTLDGLGFGFLNRFYQQILAIQKPRVELALSTCKEAHTGSSKTPPSKIHVGSFNA